MSEVLASCDRLLEQSEPGRYPRDKFAAGTQHLECLDERIELVEQIVRRQPLITIIGELLGADFKVDQISFRNPRPCHGGQKLHADAQPLTGIGQATVATAIVALTDFTLHNGATRLVPGSHRRIDLQRRSGSLDSHDDEIALTGAAGTVFIFSGHVLHSGTTNNSDQPRPALQLVWRT